MGSAAEAPSPVRHNAAQPIRNRFMELSGVDICAQLSGTAPRAGTSLQRWAKGRKTEGDAAASPSFILPPPTMAVMVAPRTMAPPVLVPLRRLNGRGGTQIGPRSLGRHSGRRVRSTGGSKRNGSEHGANTQDGFHTQLPRELSRALMAPGVNAPMSAFVAPRLTINAPIAS